MHRRQLALCLVVLGVFALYAPALRLMLIHDDAVNAIWMNRYSLLTIFTADYAAGGASARPLSNALWILTRELFGWYHPPLIHAWNVWLHVLNVALVGSLAARLGRRLGLKGLLFPAFTALIFGLYPLSFQSVIWAGAIYHPTMLAFGLLAIHASLTAQQQRSRGVWVLCIALVLGACLSHEAGFLFGLAVLLVNGILVVSSPLPFGEAERPCGRLGVGRKLAGPIIVATVALAYAMLNRVIAMQAGAKSAGLRPINEIATNAIYFMQAMVTWPVIALRPIVGLSDASSGIIVALFVLCVALMLLVLWRLRLAWLGALGVLWFLLMASLPILILDAAYVSYGPRLLYAASVGIALTWGACIAGVVHRLHSPIAKTLVLAISALLLAWGVPFITERTVETERLTPAMWRISGDLRDHTQPDAKVLFVNMPWWNAPANPAFLIGAEGMPIFQHDGAPAWTWIAANSAVQRETAYVRHPASLTQDPRWAYGQPGPDTDDAALRERMLASNAIYRFDYDAPGLRSRRVALIAPAQNEAPQDFIAVLEEGDVRFFITRAEARQCQNEIVLDVMWQRAGRATEPLGVFVHGMDAAGNQVVTADKDLLNGALPLDQLPASLSVNERRIIAPPANAPAITTINIGAYRRGDVARLPATNAGGARFDGDQISVPVSAMCE
jgi:hypothetical protein